MTNARYRRTPRGALALGFAASIALLGGVGTPTHAEPPKPTASKQRKKVKRGPNLVTIRPSVHAQRCVRKGERSNTGFRHAKDRWKRTSRYWSLSLGDCTTGSQVLRQWLYESETGLIRSAQNPNLCWHRRSSDFHQGDLILLWPCGRGTAADKTWTYHRKSGQIRARKRGSMCVQTAREDWRGGLQLLDCDERDEVWRTWNVGPNEHKVKVDRWFPIPNKQFLCPTRRGGDRDFKGHGPKVKVSAWLERSVGARAVVLKMKMSARETVYDFSHASSEWEEVVYRAPRGMRIAPIASKFRSSAEYIDRDHDIDVIENPGGELVERFEVMGDTRGNDIIGSVLDQGADKACGNGEHSFMHVRFKPAYVTIRPQGEREQIEIPPQFAYYKLKHVGGDCDFKGHGPRAEGRAHLERTDGKRALDLVIDMRLKETRADWTESYGTHRARIFTAPKGYVIDEVLSNNGPACVDTKLRGHGAHERSGRRCEATGGEGVVVDKWTIHGDHKGNDVCKVKLPRLSDVTVETNPISVRIVRR